MKNKKIELSIIFNYIMDFVYPRRCPYCDDVLPIGMKICDKCKDKFVIIKEPLCKNCGKMIEDEDEEYCLDCNRKKFMYKEGRGLFLYNKEMKESISRFKYKARYEYADYYAESIYNNLGEYIKKLDIDVIIPIPIHKNKLRMRGFNQAGLVAKRLAKKMNIEYIDDMLIRIEDTKPQKELSNIDRRNNLINAISINDKVDVPECINNILLIDDIYTTGATINACAKKLKLFNEKYNIYFVTVAIGKGM